MAGGDVPTGPDLTDEQVHALFNRAVFVCPDEGCGHQYGDDEVEEWLEDDSGPWWCPECAQQLDPVSAKVNVIDQFAEAKVEMDETFAWLAGRRPDLKPTLDRLAAETDAKVASILAGVL